MSFAFWDHHNDFLYIISIPNKMDHPILINLPIDWGIHHTRQSNISSTYLERTHQIVGYKSQENFSTVLHTSFSTPYSASNHHIQRNEWFQDDIKRIHSHVSYPSSTSWQNTSYFLHNSRMYILWVMAWLLLEWKWERECKCSSIAYQRTKKRHPRS